MYANYQANKDALKGSGAGSVVIGEDISKSSMRSTMMNNVDEDSMVKEINELQKKRGKPPNPFTSVFRLIGEDY
jgi:hypothetical protein